MNRQTISNVCDQIYRRFPEVAGSQPKVQDRPGDQALLIFSKVVTAADGRSIARTVRVVINIEGKILKVTTSR